MWFLRKRSKGCPLVRRTQHTHHVTSLERDLRPGVRQHFGSVDDRHEGRARLAPYLKIADGLSDHRAILREEDPLGFDHSRGPPQVQEKLLVGGAVGDRGVVLMPYLIAEALDLACSEA